MGEKVYLAIDLKSFYSSVECYERGLDPLTTDLVVADASRTEKTICLAISPSLKSKYHLPGRARLFEVIERVGRDNFIIARPRMKLYLDYSRKIYQIYLNFVAPDDIFAYSVDEIFCDITSYLKYTHLTPEAFATNMLSAVFKQTGITATCGIGSNLYLAKIAMDIIAKHADPNEFGARLARLDEMSYRKTLWAHQPITDFWRIGPSTAKRLKNRQMYTMGDVARCSLTNPELLYQLFGVNAEFLIDHAWGYEDATISEIKHYEPSRHSISNGQVLSRPYSFNEALTIVKEMSDDLALSLTRKNSLTDQLVLHISYDSSSPVTEATILTKDPYGRTKPKSAHSTFRLLEATNSANLIKSGFLKVFSTQVDPDFLIRKITLTAGNLISENHLPNFVQTNLFTKITPRESTSQPLQKAILDIRQRYGNTAILKGINFEPGATGRSRLKQIGGHKI